MSPANTILITGGNRGIGRAITESYLQRADTTVIAGVRDLTDSTTMSMDSISIGNNSRLLTVKIDSSSSLDAKKAVADLRALHGITHLDIVIANAGIGYYWATALETDIEEMTEHFSINAIGPLLLFQATSELMTASASPKFVVMSSVLGSMGAMEMAPLSATAYGASKAALNYMTRKIHFENEKLTSLAIHPGWIKTSIGNAGAASAGMAEAPDALEGNIGALVSLFDDASRTESSGKFLSYDGSILPW